MDVNLGKWYRANIDKKEFKQLCMKSDWQGFKHMIIFFSSLILFWLLSLYYLGNLVVSTIFYNIRKYLGM